MTGITWLHLSDWHEGYKEESVYDRNVVRQQLVDDIRERTRRISNRGDLDKIDFIVFSGDAAFSGKKGQYSQVEGFFDQILEASGLQGQRDRLFIVPGNHDLEDEALEELGGDSKKQLNTESKALGTWIDQYLDPCSGKHNLLLHPFSSYRDFVHGYTGQDQPSYASFKSLECDNGVKVALLGLNSALMARRKNERGKIDDLQKLIVGEPQVDSRLRDIGGHDVKIAVMHHPLNWLCFEDQNKIRPLLTGNFHFLLYGHRHKYEASDVVDRQGNCVILAAGATYESREHLNSYNLVHYDPVTNQGKVYLRRWDNDLRQWVKAPFLSGTNVVYSGCYQFPPLSPIPRQTLEKIGDEKWEDEERQIKLEDHYQKLVEGIKQGRVVLILGADVNLCDRSHPTEANPWLWNPNSPNPRYPPNNLEIAAYIDNEFKRQGGVTIQCPFCDQKTPEDPNDPNFPQGFPHECPLNTGDIVRLDLPYISEYFWSRSHSGRLTILRNAVNNIFIGDYQPNSLHNLLANELIKSWNTEQFDLVGNPIDVAFPLIVTTCFDQTLERAFHKVKQPYDLISYNNQDNNFCYQTYQLQKDRQGNQQLQGSNITHLRDLDQKLKKDSSNKLLTERPVILRLYGPVANDQLDGENFTITEDHFLKYLIGGILDMGNCPEILLSKLYNSHLWFLGYNLSYWHLRIISHQINQENTSHLEWWAVQETPQRLERELWQINNVTLLSSLSIGSLTSYIQEVRQRLS